MQPKKESFQRFQQNKSISKKGFFIGAITVFCTLVAAQIIMMLVIDAGQLDHIRQYILLNDVITLLFFFSVYATAQTILYCQHHLQYTKIQQDIEDLEAIDIVCREYIRNHSLNEALIYFTGETIQEAYLNI